MTPITLRGRPRPTALRAAWLFNGTDPGLQPDPVIVIEGSTIVSVGFGVPAPPETHVVDHGSATLLPGLVDTHMHLAFDASADPVTALAARDDTAVLQAMREAGRTALLGGVTTVRDLGDRNYLSLSLRGDPHMPTVVTAGPPLTTINGHCHFLGGQVGAGIDSVRAAVRAHADRGVDVIKIMASGGQLTPGTGQHLPQFTVGELRAAVDEAHRWGLPVTAHAHATQGIQNAVEAGVDGLEHATFWSQDSVDDPGDLVAAIASRRIVVGATAGVVPVAGITPPPGILQRMPLIMANMRRLQEAGVRVVAGTDAGIAPVKPHDVLRSAMSQLLHLGMTADQVLITLTSIAADVCGLGASKGRIAAGYDADLLIVDGNPIHDCNALDRISAVYRAGHRVR